MIIKENENDEEQAGLYGVFAALKNGITMLSSCLNEGWSVVRFG